MTIQLDIYIAINHAHTCGTSTLAITVTGTERVAGVTKSWADIGVSWRCVHPLGFICTDGVPTGGLNALQ